MKKIFAITAFALLASCAAFVQSSPRASADAICFNNAAPTPMPTTGRPTLGICNNNILGVQIVGPGGSPIPTSGPTAAPGPTDTNGYPLVHPTAVGTISVNCVSGCAAGSTPIPFATNGSGQLIVVPATTVPVSIQTAVAIIPAQVNACNVGFTACSNVGTTVTDGYSDLLESIFSAGFVYNFNGSTWDRGRNAGIGNGVPSTGLGAHDSYGEFLTALPTLTTGQYGSMQLDSSSRLIISPTGLPTPLATQPVSGTVAISNVLPTPIPIPTSASLYPKTVQCDPTTAANCAVVSSGGVTDSAVCTAAAACAQIANAGFGGIAMANGLYVQGFTFAYNGASYDSIRKDTYTAGPLWATEGGSTATAIAAAAAGPTVIKATAGRLSTVLTTVTGTTTPVTFFDNASACSGKIIGLIPAASVAGTIVKIDLVAALGITACGGTLSPGLTVGFY